MDAQALPAAAPFRGELPPDRDPSSVEDGRLLAAMLRSLGVGDPEILAPALLQRFGGLGDVIAADPGELGLVGASPETIAGLKQVRALNVRMARARATRRPVISSWSALTTYARAALAHEPREQFRTLFLDRRNQLMTDELVAFGAVDHAPVYPREVVRRALEVSASALILLHNHPAGDPQPSRADIDMTRKIVEGARLFDIQVHDHLIVGRNGTASFKGLGLL